MNQKENIGESRVWGDAKDKRISELNMRFSSSDAIRYYSKSPYDANPDGWTWYAYLKYKIFHITNYSYIP